MANLPPLDWQEIIRSLLSGGAAFFIWLGGKFIYNRYERRRMENENEIKEQQAGREASETVSVFAKVAQDTGQSNMELRKSLTEMLEGMFVLEKKIHGLEILTEDLRRERTQLEDKNRRLENRVKTLEDTLRANNIAIPINGNGG